MGSGMCLVPGCTAELKARGYCNNHYRKLLKNGDPLLDRRKIPKGRACTIDGCGKPHSSNGLCGMHAQRLRRNGDPLKGARTPITGACSLDGCGAPAYCKGLCHGHYHRLRRGAPLDGPIRPRNTPTDTHKKCPNCGKTKELSGFPKAKGRIASWCKECRKHYRRKLHYGVSPEEYALMSASGCEVCGAPENLVVDHDHKTGSVRGILCGHCNLAIGMVKDTPERLIGLAEYLRKHAA